jgi:hypothetical protein
MPPVNFGRGARGEGQETAYVHEDTQRKSGRSRWDWPRHWDARTCCVVVVPPAVARIISVPDVMRRSPRDAGTNEPIALGGCIGDTLAD